ncbi:uncharacterized protein LOC115034932, partial [Acyrthosiphon pisum]|uniref:Reverse transcriptase domain-containing protein n=1 Tax=Acyrthosiphon pisum TaxID=7029 RepID=A0A8R2NXQ9_ACYPI
MPETWNEAIIIPLHKKGDKTECSNYRGISLLNSVYKVFSKILLNRLTPYAEEYLGEYYIPGTGAIKKNHNMQRKFKQRSIHLIVQQASRWFPRPYWPGGCDYDFLIDLMSDSSYWLGGRDYVFLIDLMSDSS